MEDDGVMALGVAAMLAAGAPAAADPPRKQARIALPFNGGLEFAVHTDDDVVAETGKHDAEMYPPQGRWLVMTDSYASRPGPDGACAGGREVYVRLLDITTETEVSATLARSCRRGITAGDPILTWFPQGGGYTINLTSGPPVRVTFPKAGEGPKVGDAPPAQSPLAS